MFDIINRYILSPNELHKKRKETQSNELQRSYEKNASFVCPRFVRSKTTATAPDSEIDLFVSDILDKDKPTPSIVGVRSIVSKCIDGNDNGNMVPIIEVATKRSGVNGMNDKNDVTPYESTRQFPLVELGLKLAKAFENQLTSTTLCFVADASSGLGSEMLGRIISSCGAGMALVQEPVWMSMLANLVAEKVITRSQLDKIIFGLCRFNAWEVRDQVGENRTVVFTLPGQSCTATLLPSLQKAFPCERHVFVYDGLIDSTARALRILKLYEKGNLPLTMSRKISATTPIGQLTTVSKLDTLLSPLAYHQAGIIEAWLSSVDSFLKLKHSEKKSGYIPFVCRLGFLTSQVGRLGNGSVDQSQLALTNVLQYMTGSKSRPLKDEVLKKACDVLNEICDVEMKEVEKYKDILGENDKKAIEDCAFAHKGILIENKTLMDTVQPKVEWSLKAAKKLTSCACCMPGQGDSDEESDDAEAKSSPGNGIAIKKKPKTVSKPPAYVDGKTMFAFDPTRFS